jgi:hypothetical protein
MHKAVDCCLTILVTLLLSLAALAQDNAPKPKVSKDPMTAEQVAVYRAALRYYMNGHDGALNLAKQTEPLDRSGPFWDEGCVKSLDLEPPGKSAAVVHLLSPAVALSAKMVLVDPDAQSQIVKENDPGRLIKSAIDDGAKVSDKQVGDAVEKAFHTALFTFSEIVFDKQHRHAVLSYSFHCGELCGHGSTLVLKKTNGKWRTAKLCGGWVS